MIKRENRKEIGLCECCYKNPAKYLYFYYSVNYIFMTRNRTFLLCKECIKKPEYNILNMKNI